MFGQTRHVEASYIQERNVFIQCSIVMTMISFWQTFMTPLEVTTKRWFSSGNLLKPAFFQERGVGENSRIMHPDLVQKHFDQF